MKARQARKLGCRNDVPRRGASTSRRKLMRRPGITEAPAVSQLADRKPKPTVVCRQRLTLLSPGTSIVGSVSVYDGRRANEDNRPRRPVRDRGHVRVPAGWDGDGGTTTGV